MAKKLKIVSQDYGTQLQSMLVKPKAKVKFAAKTYTMSVRPTKIKSGIRAKAVKINPIRHVENSLDAAAKLHKMEVMQWVYVTQKEKTHFQTAARLNGFTIVTRQGVTNTNKVRVYKTA